MFYQSHHVAWSFETAKYRVECRVYPEDENPADFDDDETVEAIRNGSLEWFRVHMVVIANGDIVGEDHLGACCYNSVSDFVESHRDNDSMNRNCEAMRKANGDNHAICHYFPDMVAIAVKDARDNLRKRAELASKLRMVA